MNGKVVNISTNLKNKTVPIFPDPNEFSQGFSKKSPLPSKPKLSLKLKDLGTKFKTWAKTDKGKRTLKGLSEGLIVAGSEISGSSVSGVELIDTHGNIQKQSEEIPDISAISPVTKKKK